VYDVVNAFASRDCTAFSKHFSVAGVYVYVEGGKSAVGPAVSNFAVL